jgi:hypothetical protein
MEEDIKGTGLSNVIRIDDERVREHLGHIVRGTVEETLKIPKLRQQTFETAHSNAPRPSSSAIGDGRVRWRRP